VSPRFTVLMPTHYRPDVIGFAIQSVLNQSETDFELFIVGDGARPETAAAVGRFTDPRIRWFDLPKTPGFGYVNRNIALRESRGELIAFAADDDLMSRPLGIARRGA
jgi:glycosyltransferase involved in cell wall biosynthesis